MISYPIAIDSADVMVSNSHTFIKLLNTSSPKYPAFGIRGKGKFTAGEIKIFLNLHMLLKFSIMTEFLERFDLRNFRDLSDLI